MEFDLNSASNMVRKQAAVFASKRETYAVLPSSTFSESLSIFVWF